MSIPSFSGFLGKHFFRKDLQGVGSLLGVKESTLVVGCLLTETAYTRRPEVQ